MRTSSYTTLPLQRQRPPKNKCHPSFKLVVVSSVAIVIVLFSLSLNIYFLLQQTYQHSRHHQISNIKPSTINIDHQNLQQKRLFIQSNDVTQIQQHQQKSPPQELPITNINIISGSISNHNAVPAPVELINPIHPRENANSNHQQEQQTTNQKITPIKPNANSNNQHHHRQEQEQEQQTKNQKITPIKPHLQPLIVGASDGSGTRSIVSILIDLGVPFLYQTDDTYDVNGIELTAHIPKKRNLLLDVGWPGVVREGLRYANGHVNFSIPSNNTSLNSAMQGIQQMINTQQLAIHAILNPSSNLKSNHFITLKGPNINRQIYKAAIPQNKARHISYGIKAPASMMILPLFEHVYQHHPRLVVGDGADNNDEILSKGFLFIHVVRDGRDIAFSQNQSPVTKFYDLVHHHQEQNNIHNNNKSSNNKPLSTQKCPSCAIEIWNTFNVEVDDWLHHRKMMAITNTTHNNNINNTHPFDYFTIRIEDTISPDINTKYNVFKSLANFVGSPLSNEEICCLANQDRSSKIGDVKQKKKLNYDQVYGKWKIKLKENITLSEELHVIGSNGLDRFGYEPLQLDFYKRNDGFFMNGYSNENSKNHVCKAMNDDVTTATAPFCKQFYQKLKKIRTQKISVPLQKNK